MYTMKEACEKTGLNYETLKFYCNQGLVPYVGRDDRNRRVFDDHDIAWINSLSCLKNCNMGIAEMKEYLRLCLVGKDSIPQRKEILARKRGELEQELERIQKSIDYIDWKQDFYDGVTVGNIPYHSNLIPKEEKP